MKIGSRLSWVCSYGLFVLVGCVDAQSVDRPSERAEARVARLARPVVAAVAEMDAAPGDVDAAAARASEPSSPGRSDPIALTTEEDDEPPMEERARYGTVPDAAEVLSRETNRYRSMLEAAPVVAVVAVDSLTTEVRRVAAAGAHYYFPYMSSSVRVLRLLRGGAAGMVPQRLDLTYPIHAHSLVMERGGTYVLRLSCSADRCTPLVSPDYSAVVVRNGLLDGFGLSVDELGLFSDDRGSVGGFGMRPIRA